MHLVVPDKVNIRTKTKPKVRKGGDIDPDVKQFVCQDYGQVCLPNIGLSNCRRSDADRPLITYEVFLENNHLRCDLGRNI